MVIMELKEISIKVIYYAIFREQAGKSNETFTTLSGNAEELYHELATKYKFSLSDDIVRVSINNEYVSFNAHLNDGDEVIFIPPVAGG
ncbi:MAG: molybdopterin converting factor subunit 1 [Lysobacterales bacterium]|jgi:molybdopterin converting factor subunit 1